MQPCDAASDPGRGLRPGLVCGEDQSFICVWGAWRPGPAVQGRKGLEEGIAKEKDLGVRSVGFVPDPVSLFVVHRSKLSRRCPSQPKY